MNGYVSGFDIDRDKIVAIYIEDEDAERDVTEEIAMVYLEGGHIITLPPDEGRLVREFWRKGKGGSVNLHDLAKHRGEKGEPPEPPVTFDDHRR